MCHLSYWGFPITWGILYILCRNIFRNSAIFDSFPLVEPGHIVHPGTLFISATWNRHHMFWMFQYVPFHIIPKHIQQIQFCFSWELYLKDSSASPLPWWFSNGGGGGGEKGKGTFPTFHSVYSSSLSLSSVPPSALCFWFLSSVIGALVLQTALACRWLFPLFPDSCW